MLKTHKRSSFLPKIIINNYSGGGINKIIISEIAHMNVGIERACVCILFSYTSFETLPENNIINQNENKKINNKITDHLEMFCVLKLDRCVI